MQVSAQPPGPDSPSFAAATVVDRIDIGFLIKYVLRFDDGPVSGVTPHALHIASLIRALKCWVHDFQDPVRPVPGYLSAMCA